MVIKLYIDYGSQPSRAVLALCISTNIPHQVIQTSIFKGQTRSKQYKQINPMKLVPAIVDTDNGLTLSESHSILKYLAQKYKVDQNWYPRTDLAKQAKINEFLDFHHSKTRKCSFLVFHTLFAPVLKTGDPTFNPEWTYKVVRAALRDFESIYLKGKSFIGGDRVCIGDLIAFYDITMLELLDFDYSAYPEIVRWVALMRTIPAVTKADQRFEKNKEKIKQLNPNRAKL